MRQSSIAIVVAAIALCVSAQEPPSSPPSDTEPATTPPPEISETEKPVPSATSTPKKKPAAPAMRPAVALRATRPWSFTATVGPVALGTALAFKIEDAFNLPLLGLTLVTTLAVHAAGNLMNTLVDFTRGVDTASSSDLTLVRGDLSADQVGKLILGSYGLAAAAAAPLCALSRAPLPQLVALLVTGAGSAYVYTGGPGLKYKALGDILISTTFGPLLVAFAYLTQAGTLGWRPLLAAMPMTMHIEAILHVRQLTSRPAD